MFTEISIKETIKKSLSRTTGKGRINPRYHPNSTEKLCDTSHTDICYPITEATGEVYLQFMRSARFLERIISNLLLPVRTNHRLSENNHDYDLVLVNEFL